MYTKNLSAIAVTQLILSGAIIFSLAFSAGAQTSNIKTSDDEAESKLAGISFPIAELNNCTSKEECKTFCNEPDNFKACFAFAKKHKLVREVEEKSDEEIEKFAEAMRAGGPGGCQTPNECRAYCDDTNNIEQCVAFAEENNLIPKEELEQAKQVIAAVKAGAKLPPQCKNREQCEIFCSASPENMEQCIDFAQKAGFMKPEEAEQAKKMAEVMRSGETPGNCKGHQECEAYCYSQENFAECQAFAEKMGFVLPEQEGMMSEGHEMSQMPDSVTSCLKEALGESDFEAMQKGQLRSSPEMELKMNNCFSQMQGEMMGHEGEFENGEHMDMKYQYIEGGTIKQDSNAYPKIEGQPGMMPSQDYQQDYQHYYQGKTEDGMMPPQNYQDGYENNYQDSYQGNMMDGMPVPSGDTISPPPYDSFTPPPPSTESEPTPISLIDRFLGFVLGAFR